MRYSAKIMLGGGLLEIELAVIWYEYDVRCWCTRDWLRYNVKIMLSVGRVLEIEIGCDTV